jgi:hypothetical protein
MTTVLKPGVYVLSEDVENPSPDRRQKYDWRAHAVWRKGDRFDVVTRMEYGWPDRDELVESTRLQRCQAHASLYQFGPGCEGWELLAAKLTPVDENVDDILRLTYDKTFLDGDDLVRHMVNTGKWSVEYVKSLFTELDELSNKEE